jgi:hypothetical protein
MYNCRQGLSFLPGFQPGYSVFLNAEQENSPIGP